MPGEPIVHIRQPGIRCLCKRHQVELPFAETTQLLICRDWEDSKTHDRLVEWRTQSKYASGILYAYESEYTPETTEFARIDQLPSFGSAHGPSGDG